MKILKPAWIVCNIVSYGVFAIMYPKWVIDPYRNIDWGLLLVCISMYFLLNIVAHWLNGIPPFHLTAMGAVHLLTSKIRTLTPTGMPTTQQLHLEELPDELTEEPVWPEEPKPKPKNFNLIGTEVKYVGIITCLGLLAILPWMANVEEIIFRAGTLNWPDALYRSVLFGFGHPFIGMSAASAGALVLLGMFLSFFYFQGGVALSSQAHFLFNFVGIGLLLYLNVKRSFFS